MIFIKTLSYKFNFENKMTKKNFYNVINKAPNKGPLDKYEYNNWTKKEKKEFKPNMKKYFLIMIILKQIFK
jgi:hypothetical protein